MSKYTHWNKHDIFWSRKTEVIFSILKNRCLQRRLKALVSNGVHIPKKLCKHTLDWKRKQREDFAAFFQKPTTHAAATSSIPIKTEMLVFLQWLCPFGEFHVYERSLSSFFNSRLPVKQSCFAPLWD